MVTVLSTSTTAVDNLTKPYAIDDPISGPLHHDLLSNWAPECLPRLPLNRRGQDLDLSVEWFGIG